MFLASNAPPVSAFTGTVQVALKMLLGRVNTREKAGKMSLLYVCSYRIGMCKQE